MSTLSLHLRRLVRLGRRNRMVQDERGFTLIEMIVAASIFIGVAAALAGVLGSSIVAHDLARERTFAQQSATAQIECIRRLAYQDVGLYPSGNPTGKIGYTGGGNFCQSGSYAISKTGIQATMVTTVDYVDDPVPTGYSSAANYKRVTVSVTRNSDGMVLASEVTFVAPIQRAPYGGLNNAILNVTVADLVLSSPVPGATVSLANGPSAPRSDDTDSAGLVSFAALTPTTTSGAATDYYDISVAKSGYTTYAPDLPPAAAAHKQLSPAATVPATIRIYQGATINVNLVDSGGAPYTGAAVVKVTSAATSTTQSYAVSGGAQSITAFGGTPVLPGVNYTLRAYTTTGGLCADPVLHSVPDAYPTVLTTSYTLTLRPCDVGSLTVNVNQLGAPASGAVVTISGGPNDYTAITQSTTAGGATTFTNLPSGTDTYSISVSKLYTTGTATAVVNTGATTSVTVNLPDPPIGNIRAHVQWPAAAVVGASVHVTGGPGAIDQTFLTDGAGDALFVDLPSGTGYTVAATKNGITQTVTGVSISTGSTTVTTITMPTATITVNVTWAGVAVGSAATVTITGGPMGGSYPGSTNSSGVATITVPQSVSDTYTVAASKSGGSGSTTVASVPGTGATANVAFTQLGTITVNTATWGGLVVGSGNVSITGGPVGGTFTGTTNASGVSGAITVPASSTAYTVSVAKNTGSGSGSVATVTASTNTNVGVALTPTKSVVITVNKASGVAAGTGVVVRLSLSGGPNGTAGSAPFYQYTLTTNASSQVTITSLPAATGYTYTVKADVYNGASCPALTNKSTTAGSLSAAAATTTLTLTLNSTTCPLSPWPQ